MAQDSNDYEIGNVTASAARSALNEIFQAILTNNSGDAEPSYTQPNMFWYEEDTNLLKMRNEANSGWITVGYMNQTNNQLEVRSDVIQAASGSGISVKDSGGTTIIDLSVASQATAEAGTNNDQIMTPLRVKQAIDENDTPQPTTFGEVGTYALLMKITDGNITAGSVYNGSDLRPAAFGRNSWNGASVQDIVGDYVAGTSMSGTWRAMGGSDNFITASDVATLFLRIT